MINFLKKTQFALLGAALICGCLGTLLVLYTEQAISMIQIIMGAALIIYGIMAIARNIRRGLNVFGSGFGIGIGILLIVIGIWMCSGPLEVAYIILVFLAIMLLLHGSVDLGYSIRQKQLEFSGWVVSLIAAIISMAAGVIVLINPFKSAVVVYTILGWFIVFDAVFDLYLAVLMQILEYRYEKAQIKAEKLKEQGLIAATAEPVDKNEIPFLPADADYETDE